MPTPTGAIFLAVVALILVHELDAVRRHEWRFFLGRASLDDETAYRVFAALHAPLFLLVLWGLSVPSVRLVIDGFVVLHAALHLALRDHPSLEFEGSFSWTWILGSAALGALHLGLLAAV